MSLKSTSTAEIESLFARFQATGDPAALAEVFDRTAPELLRVARFLAANEAEAEDVVQSTYLAAIEAVASWDRTRPLLPWLMGILARQAALARRRGARTIDPARLETRRQAAPDEKARASELSQALAVAWPALSDVDRGVLEPVLLGQRAPHEVARERALDPATVRQRLKRALGRLQRLLPPGFALGVLFIPRRGLAAVRGEVLSAAGGGSAAVSASATGAAGSGAALKLAAAGVALTAAGAAWWAWPASEGEPGGTVDTASAGLTLSAAAGDGGPDAAAHGTLADTEPAAGRELAQADAHAAGSRAAQDPPERTLGPGYWIAGKITGIPEGSRESARLTAHAVRPQTLETVVGSESAPDGGFALDVTSLFVTRYAEWRLDELRVAIDHPDCAPTEVRLAVAGVGAARPRIQGSTRIFDIGVELKIAGKAVGRILAPGFEQQAQEGEEWSPRAVLTTHSTEWGFVPALDEVVPGDAGAFVLRAAAAGQYLAVFACPGYLPAVRVVDLEPHQILDLGSIELKQGASITGRVTYGGDPAGGATVSACLQQAGEAVRLGDRLLRFNGEQAWEAQLSAQSTPDGQFEFTGLLPGARYELRPSRLGRFHVVEGAHWPEPTVVESPAEHVALAFQTACLTIKLTEGSLPLTNDDTRSLQVELRDTGGDSNWSSLGGWDHGACTLQVPAGRRMEVLAHGGRYSDHRGEFATGQPGEETVLHIDLRQRGDLSSLALNFTGEGADEFRTIGVALYQLDHPELRTPQNPWPDRHEEVSWQGDAFLVDEIPPGLWRVAIHTDGNYNQFIGDHLPVELDVTLSPGEKESVELHLIRGGRFQVRVLSPTGLQLGGPFKLRDSKGNRLNVRLEYHHPDGSWGLPDSSVEPGVPNRLWEPLPAGKYELELASEGYRSRVVPVTIEVGKLSIVDVTMERE